jgi:hypothetical protein
MRVALKDIHAAIKERYRLDLSAIDGYLYVWIIKGTYGLPQAGILTNKDFVLYLQMAGLFQQTTKPSLVIQQTQSILFYQVVYQFDVKYGGAEHAEQMIHVL